MEQQKDNFWLYIGSGIALVIVMVFVMKGQRADMEPGVTNASAQAESKAEVEKAIARNHSQQ